MSGRRRVKNIVYDDDEDDYWPEEEIDSVEEEDVREDYEGCYGEHCSQRRDRPSASAAAQLSSKAALQKPNITPPRQTETAAAAAKVALHTSAGAANASAKQPENGAGAFHLSRAAMDSATDAAAALAAPDGDGARPARGVLSTPSTGKRVEECDPAECIIASSANLEKQNFYESAFSGATSITKSAVAPVTPSVVATRAAIPSPPEGGRMRQSVRNATAVGSCLSDPSFASENSSANAAKVVTSVPAAPLTTAAATAVSDTREPESLTLVVIGHVDAGKSTLVGQLLCVTGAVQENVVAKLKRLSAAAGKSSSLYAWLCDEGEDERERGVTIDVCIKTLITPNTRRRINLLDAPGHRDLVPNTLGGIVLADAALLVVDAVRFGVGLQGQTKEHVLIARSLNIQTFIIVVNKMDELRWKKEAFDEIVTKLRAFICGPQVCCSSENIFFVPLSAFTGVNVASDVVATALLIVQSKKNSKRKGASTTAAAPGSNFYNVEELKEQSELLRSWWSGPSLLSILETVQVPTRYTQEEFVCQPFAACVADMWSIKDASLCMSFKVVRGGLSVGDTVAAFPSNTPLVCRDIHICGLPRKTCIAGDLVEKADFGFVVCAADTARSSGGIDAVGVGSVLCSLTHTLPVVTSFLCRVTVFSPLLPLVQGRQFVGHIHTMTCQCSILKVIAVIDKKTGEISRQSGPNTPCVLRSGMGGILEVDIAPTKACVHLKNPRQERQPTSLLSRIILRERGRTVAAGVLLDSV